MSTRGQCVFCSKPVEAIETAAWPVVGWEAERGRGGANQIIGRERVLDGRIAHAACARRAAELDRAGIAAEQTTLI